MDKFVETFMYSMSPVLVHILCTQVTECSGLMTYIINLIWNLLDCYNTQFWKIASYISVH